MGSSLTPSLPPPPTHTQQQPCVTTRSLLWLSTTDPECVRLASPEMTLRGPCSLPLWADPGIRVSWSNFQYTLRLKPRSEIVRHNWRAVEGACDGQHLITDTMEDTMARGLLMLSLRPRLIPTTS